MIGHVASLSPPSSIGVDIESGEKAVVRWQPPLVGNYSYFKLSVMSLSDPSETIRKTSSLGKQRTFLDLTPGATYEAQVYTVYDDKESQDHISTNFTTRPNTPGRFITWFRNETTLLVLWQPPFPHHYFTDYKVSIDPQDAKISDIYVPKQGDPPGPAQAAFNDLVPGKAYNISVRTVSEDQLSEPTTAQYRTVPLRPINVIVKQEDIGTDFFIVQWDGPDQNKPWKISEFDRYQAAIGIRRRAPQIIEKGAPRMAKFDRNILPGRTYQVLVKTVSGSVGSWPADRNVTTRPYPVRNLTVEEDTETEELVLSWNPDPGSLQDSYKVILFED